MKQGRKSEPAATGILISLLLITACTLVNVQAKTNAFTATISPTSATANRLVTYTVTVTNTGTGSTLGSTSITVPEGFTIIEPITILVPSSSWSYSLAANVISLTASGGGTTLDPGESVVFTFSAVAPTAPGVTTWTTDAHTAAGGGGQLMSIDGAQPTVIVSLSSPLVAPTISASPAGKIDQGQMSTLMQLVGPSGGTPPYSYQWSESYNGGSFSTINGADGASYTFSTTTSTATGTWSFKLTVNDSSYVSATVISNQVNVIVNSELASPEVTATPDVVNQTQPSTLTSTPVTTGTSPYSYQWFQRAPGGEYTPVGSNIPSYTFPSSTTVGVWDFILQVTDSAGARVNSSSTHVTVTAAPTFTITVTQSPHGRIVPGTTSIIQGASQSFAISPDAGYQITDVVVDGGSVGAVSSYAFNNVDADHTLTAAFTQIEYTLTVSTVGGGTVVLNPSQSTYHYGNVVQLTANPLSGWSFSDWSGDIHASTNPISIIINGTTSITATFVQNSFTLSISTVGNGVVSKNPDQASYHLGDIVTLAASPSSGWGFGGWSGAFVSSLNPVSVVINGTTSVTATFAQSTYSLTVISVGGGSVVKTPDQLTYHFGDVVQLTAAPVAGWSFSGWSGDFSNSLNPVSVIINGSTSVTVTFIQNAYVLSISTIGSGTVSKNPDRASYNLGDVVQLIGVSSPGWSFSSWSGSFSSSANPVSVTINGTTSVTATFVQNTYTLTVSTVGSGSVSLNNTGPFHLGEVVRLTANPSADWSFSGWAGGLSGSANPAELTITGNLMVTASFIQATFSMTISTIGDGSVVKSPDQATYRYGDVVQLTAVPSSSWRFAGWNGSVTGSLNPTSLTISGNTAVTAIFLVNQYIITSSAGVGGSISPVGTTIVDYYGSQTYLITPSVGYYVVSVLVNGINVGPVSSFTVSNVTGDTTVTATFTPSSLTLEASAGPHGSISPNGIVEVYYGDDRTLTISPDTGYHVSNVLVDGVSVGAVTSYTFTHVTISHNISATFAINSVIISAFAATGGTINPSGMVLVDWNGTLKFTINPDPNYQIESVKVDGVSVGVVNSYTFTWITADHNISASFAPGTSFSITVTSLHGTPTPSAEVNAGSSFNVSVASVEGDASHRWICTGYSIDGGSIVSGTSYIFTNVQANHAIAFYWQEQYHLTVNTQAGTASGAGWYNLGTSVTVSVPDSIITGESGTRQIFTGWSGDASGTALTSNPITIDGPKTATANWKTQYYLTVTSATGNPTGKGWYDAGASATINIDVPASNSSDTRVVVIWKGTSGGYTGTSASSQVTMSHAITEEAVWTTQYLVTFALSGNALQAETPQTEWVDSGTAATGTFVPTIIDSAGSTRIVFVGDDRPSIITSPANVTGTYKTQYLVWFVQDGLDSNVSGTLVTVRGESKGLDNLPAFWVDQGDSVPFTYEASIENSDGVQFVLKSANSTSPLTVNAPTTILAEYGLKVESSFDLNTIALLAAVVCALAVSPVSVLSWRRRKRIITPTAGEGGYISPSTRQKIERGGDSTVFIVTARYGYKIKDIVIDNKTHLGAVRTYKFTDVNESHTISAKFARS
jgi:hypothetical protein